MKKQLIRSAVDSSANPFLARASLSEALPVLERIAEQVGFWDRLIHGVGALVKAVKRYLDDEGVKPAPTNEHAIWQALENRFGSLRGNRYIGGGWTIVQTPDLGFYHVVVSSLTKDEAYQVMKQLREAQRADEMQVRLALLEDENDV